MDKTQPQAKPFKKVGPIVSTLIVILLVIIVILYAFASSLNRTQMQNLNPTADPTLLSNTPSAPQVVAPITNTSDDPQSLQNDLNRATQGL